MNSMLDSLTPEERRMAYSGSPVNLWLTRLRKRIAIAERRKENGEPDNLHTEPRQH